MNILSKEQAYALLNTYINNEYLQRHSKATAMIMKHIAQQLQEDENLRKIT